MKSSWCVIPTSSTMAENMNVIWYNKKLRKHQFGSFFEYLEIKQACLETENQFVLAKLHTGQLHETEQIARALNSFKETDEVRS